MKQNKKKRKKIFALILLLTISVGYALLSTTLSIIGTAGIKSNTWNIHWDDESVVVTPNSVSGTEPIVTGTNDNTVEFSTTLELPGDFYEFTVDAVNEGSIDGTISLIVNKTYKVVNNVDVEQALPSYILYTVKYSDNTTPQEGDVLKSNQSKTYKIRVEYDSNSEVLPNEDTTYKFKFTTDYEQYKDPTPEPRTCGQFEDDSWDTIAHNVTLKPDTYPIGCEKEVDLGTYGVHTVRVANNTISNECNSTDFSQTACGFVLEFKDVITTHRMNPWENGGDVNGDGNRGGWEYTDMRAFLNSTIYEYKNINYSAGGIYNSFPSDLKPLIMNTMVVSGYGLRDSKNSITTDKIYLLSPHEVWEDVDGSIGSGIDYDKSYNNTKQLDYYKNKGVTSNRYSMAIKYNNGSNSNWWLRSAGFVLGDDFYLVNNNGSWDDLTCQYVYGVSPAFRIGKDWVLTNNTNPLKNQKWEYYYNNSLKLQNGWYKLKDFSGNDQYYFFENGYMKLGWYTENNNTYYLSEFDGDNNNYVDGNRVHDVTLEIDGVSYTFDSNGVCTNCN